MTMEQMVASIQQIQSRLSSLSMGVPPTPAGASSAGFDQIVASMTPSMSTATSLATSAATSATASATASASAGTSSAATSAATSASGSSSSGSVTGAEVVADAKKYLGVPYVLGGESTSGMDCSGLVQKVYKDLGVTLPRLVHEQKLKGTAVPSLAEAKPGDLIVFKGGGHIAIYAGNDTVIHAPYPGRTVSEQKLWVGDSGIETIRRIVPGNSTAKAAAPAPAAPTASKLAVPAPTTLAPTIPGQATSAPGIPAPTTGTGTPTASSAALTAAQATLMAQMTMFSGASGVMGNDPALSGSSVSAFLSSMPSGISTNSVANSVADFLATQQTQMEPSQL